MKRPLIIILSIVTLLIAAGAQTESVALSPPVTRDTCVEACQKDNRDRVKECNLYYPPESQSIKHRECLDKAKAKFDACIATCR